MGRGIGLNKPCVKCGREIPAAYKSPIPGFCGRCTDEVLRTLGHGPGGGAGDHSAAAPPRNLMLLGVLIGIGATIVVVTALSLAAPSAFDAVFGGLRGALGLG